MEIKDDINLNRTEQDMLNDFSLPKKIEGSLDLRSLSTPEEFSLPEKIEGSLDLPTSDEMRKRVDKMIQDMENGAIDIHGNPINSESMDNSDHKSF